MFWNYFFFARCCYFCCCCCRLCVPERLVLRHNEVIVLPLSQTFSGGWLLCCCVSIIFCFLSSAILCATDKSGGSRQPLRHNNVPSRSTDRHIHRRLHSSYATCETHDYFYSTHTFTCHFHACNFVCYGGHTFCFFFLFFFVAFGVFLCLINSLLVVCAGKGVRKGAEKLAVVSYIWWLAHESDHLEETFLSPFYCLPRSLL